MGKVFAVCLIVTTFDLKTVLVFKVSGGYLMDRVHMFKSASLKVVKVAVNLKLFALNVPQVFFGIFETDHIKVGFCIIILKGGIVMHLVTGL